MKTKTLKQIGYTVGGVATCTTWDEMSGTIEMDRCFIPLGKMRKTKLLNSINDGGFGVQSINSAVINIYDQYENDYKEYNRTIHVNHPIHIVLFGKRGI